METNLDIIYLTQKYIEAKAKLDIIERIYEKTRAQVYMSTSIQGLGAAPSRDAATTLQLETTNADMLDNLYNARGEARKYFYLREAVLDAHKQVRSEL